MSISLFFNQRVIYQRKLSVISSLAGALIGAMADPDVPVGTTDDLASLGRLDESILLNELKHRYNNDRIYVSFI